METWEQFVIVISAIVGAVIILKVFFSIWRLIEKKINPEFAERISHTPETAFKNLKDKEMTIFLKNGEIRSKKIRLTKRWLGRVPRPTA